MRRTFTPGKVVIHCPKDVVDGVTLDNYGFSDFWGVDPSSQIQNLFSGSLGNLLTLNTVSASDYTPMSIGQDVNIKDGISSSRVFVETKRLGFRLKVRDQREDLRIAFEELMGLTIGNNCQEATPILIEDYCYLRTKEDRCNGYRPRIGFFTKSLQGLRGNIIQGTRASCKSPMEITDSCDRFGAGFEFEFMELRRGVYY